MEDKESTSPIRKKLIAGAVAVGTVFGAAGVASAVTNQGDTSSTDPTVQADDEADEIDDEANEGVETDDDDDGDHGRMGDETPLTGSVAEQVTAAAVAAVPGGTVTKVEQEGTGYEAHVTDADGNEVEVYFDQDMNVLETEQGR